MSLIFLRVCACVCLVEHYQKKHSTYHEDPAHPNEVRVAGDRKARDLCAKASHFLKVYVRMYVHVLLSANGDVPKALKLVTHM